MPYNMLANSQGHFLLDHLKAVSIVAEQMGKMLGLSDDLIEEIRVAALLHDIGKATKNFQENIHNVIEKN